METAHHKGGFGVTGQDAGHPVEFSIWAFRVEPERGSSFRTVLKCHAGAWIAIRIPKSLAGPLAEAIAGQALPAAGGRRTEGGRGQRSEVGGQGAEARGPRHVDHRSRAREALAVMWSAYQEPAVRLCDLEARFGCNRSTISQEFRRAYGEQARILGDRKRALYANRSRTKGTL